LQLSQKVQEEECPPLESRINALLKLEEVKAQEKNKLDQHQHIVKDGLIQNLLRIETLR
jgi:hypothetical protein